MWNSEFLFAEENAVDLFLYNFVKGFFTVVYLLNKTANLKNTINSEENLNDPVFFRQNLTSTDGVKNIS